MKTINDAAQEYAINKYEGCTGIIEDTLVHFKAGAEFAQRWVSVEEELPEIGCTVFVKKELRQGDTWVQHIYSVSTRLAPSGEWESIKWSDVGFTRGIVTHWRPIELK